MKLYIIVRDFEKTKTLQGTHARAYLDETEARNYYKSCPDDEPKRFVTAEI